MLRSRCKDVQIKALQNIKAESILLHIFYFLPCQMQHVPLSALSCKYEHIESFVIMIRTISFGKFYGVMIF